MDEKKLYDAITDIPDTIIEEADKSRTGKSSQNRRVFSHKYVMTLVAAGLVVVLLGVGIMGRIIRERNNAGGISKDMLLLQINYPATALDFADWSTQREYLNSYELKDSFIEGVNQFSYETISQIFTSEDGNINYSPVSLYMALGMAATGTDGNTAAELYELLKVENGEELLKQCEALYRNLYCRGNEETGNLLIANSIWLDKNMNIKNDYVERLADNFFAASFAVDYKDENTQKAMEEWVSDTTKGLIKPDIELSNDAIMNLMNTVYFYSEWVDRFNEKNTKEDIFYLENGEEVTCDFMNMTMSSHSFSRGENYTRSSLGLKTSASMIFILPDEGVSVRELLATPESVQEIFEGGEMGNGKVVWKLPKFDFASKLNLKDSLETLGVSGLFNESADFSNITESIAYISGISQETHIAIDEKGVEAAAFTNIEYAGAAEPKDNAEMILDRPFIFAIKASNGTLLFVGICDNPVQN